MTNSRMNEVGYFEWSPGTTLAWIQVIGPESYEWIYEPNESDIENLEKTWDLGANELLTIVRNADPETYGIVLDVEKYRAGKGEPDA